MSSSSKSRGRLLPALLVATVVIPLVFALGSARAQPTELFFSEYIEGSSNNKALEIFNGTGATVNLGASTYNVQMFFNGSSVAGLTINLVGTVADGDVFVLAQASAGPTILAQADQTNGSGWFNGDDAVVLRKGTTVIDVIGQIGFDPGTEWGTGVTSTADNTLRRKGTIEAGRDADIVLFDPDAQRIVRAVDLHHTSDYTAYEGMEASGIVRSVFVRGEAVVRDGAFVGQRGFGRFLERQIANLRLASGVTMA